MSSQYVIIIYLPNFFLVVPDQNPNTQLPQTHPSTKIRTNNWTIPYRGSFSFFVFYFCFIQSSRDRITISHLVVLVWLGSGMVRPHSRCLGLNKHVNFGVCLFLTGVREVPEPSDPSTASVLFVLFFSALITSRLCVCLLVCLHFHSWIAWSMTLVFGPGGWLPSWTDRGASGWKN